MDMLSIVIACRSHRGLRRGAALALLVVLVTLLGGCGDDSSPDQPIPTLAPRPTLDVTAPTATPLPPTWTPPPTLTPLPKATIDYTYQAPTLPTFVPPTYTPTPVTPSPTPPGPVIVLTTEDINDTLADAETYRDAATLSLVVTVEDGQVTGGAIDPESGQDILITFSVRPMEGRLIVDTVEATYAADGTPFTKDSLGAARADLEQALTARIMAAHVAETGIERFGITALNVVPGGLVVYTLTLP